VCVRQTSFLDFNNKVTLLEGEVTFSLAFIAIDRSCCYSEGFSLFIIIFLPFLPFFSALPIVIDNMRRLNRRKRRRWTRNIRGVWRKGAFCDGGFILEEKPHKSDKPNHIRKEKIREKSEEEKREFCFSFFGLPARTQNSAKEKVNRNEREKFRDQMDQ
jgi:hypothetical protein